MWFAIHLARRGVITAEQLFEAVETQSWCRPPLGELAVKSGVMTMKEVFSVLSRQAIQPAPFGELAEEMGLLDRAQIAELLLQQAEQTPELGEVLIEMGLVSRATADAEMAFARKASARSLSTSDPQGGPVHKERVAAATR